jgi:hypothetical protein
MPRPSQPMAAVKRSRRNEFRAETQRIETQLGAMLGARGFKVVLNWHPTVGPDGDAGEMDMIPQVMAWCWR